MHQTLRVARVNSKEVDKSALKSKKYNFNGISGTADCTSNGQFTLTRWDQYINASAYGPNEKERDFISFQDIEKSVWRQNSYMTLNGQGRTQIFDQPTLNRQPRG